MNFIYIEMLFGIKPLYYYSNNEYFVFASEIKAIYSILEKKPLLNFNAVDNILNYAFNPGVDTIFYGIKKVMPGEIITVSKREVVSQKFFKLKYNSEKSEKISKEEFKELFEKVIKENSCSDVPGGFFTSGGLDSSLITSMILKKESNYTIPISIKFLPNSVDDEKYGKMLSKNLNKEFEWVNISDQIARDTLEELIKFLDEPLENPTHVGTYLMAKRAKELGLKTIITGDGADEFFIGYDRHKYIFENRKDLYLNSSHILSHEDINKLYKKEILKEIQSKQYMIENISNLDQALIYERGQRLPEYHNMRLDRMTMAHGIEAKVPFQDRRIVEYSLKISNKDLMKKELKGWLKEFSEIYLPKELIYRKKSIFPSLPNQWLDGKGILWAKNILLNNESKIDNYINKDILLEYINEHQSGKQKRGKILWALIVLELWLQNLKNW